MKLEAGVHVTPNVVLLRQLGEGGMGAVWVAKHLALNTEVAVKFLLGDYANNPAARARFSQEAAAASQVKSSHVVKIYDYGITDTNEPFIVMELLEGTDLAKRIEEQKKIAPAELVTIVTQLCKALSRAHEQNMVHRDVKPENVFLTREDGDLFVKLLDFGVAKTSQMRALATDGGRRSTLASESLGTPYYMSPEQFKSSKTIDHRSDLWSVGVLAYEALTGTLPFQAETVAALAIVVNEAEPIPPSQVNPALPSSFDAWFAKACAHDPADRFQSARALSDALTLAFGTMSTVPRPIESGSYRQVVISHAPPEVDDPSTALRDTSFAATGASSAASKNHVMLYAVLGAVVCAIVAIAWIAMHGAQSGTNAAPVASSPPPPRASAPPTSELAPPPSDSSTSRAPVETATVASATKPNTKTHGAAPATSASAPPAGSTKGKNERDIW